LNEWLGSNEETVILRASEASVDLDWCLGSLSNAMRMGERHAESLYQMVNEGFLSEQETIRLREARSRMVEAAGEGDVAQVSLWSERLTAFVGSRAEAFAAFRISWLGIRNEMDRMLEKAACLGLEERQDAVDEFNAAFSRKDERKANSAISSLEVEVTRKIESSTVLREASSLCALARERLAATESTCCWASPVERRKATAWVLVLEGAAAEGRTDLLALAVPQFREFVRLHDEGHGNEVVALRREIAERLDAAIIIRDNDPIRNNLNEPMCEIMEQLPNHFNTGVDVDGFVWKTLDDLIERK
jgi:hypothetical protein